MYVVVLQSLRASRIQHLCIPIADVYVLMKVTNTLYFELYVSV